MGINWLHIIKGKKAMNPPSKHPPIARIQTKEITNASGKSNLGVDLCVTYTNDYDNECMNLIGSCISIFSTDT